MVVACVIAPRTLLIVRRQDAGAQGPRPPPLGQPPRRRPRFDWLREPASDAVATPPIYMAFDLLYRDGRNLSARPPRDRRARLEDVVAGSELVFAVRRLAPGSLEAWKQMVERGGRGAGRQGRGQR